jgi:hypothetical protein
LGEFAAATRPSVAALMSMTKQVIFMIGWVDCREFALGVIASAAGNLRIGSESQQQVSVPELVLQGFFPQVKSIGKIADHAKHRY